MSFLISWSQGSSLYIEDMYSHHYQVWKHKHSDWTEIIFHSFMQGWRDCVCRCVRYVLRCREETPTMSQMTLQRTSPSITALEPPGTSYPFIQLKIQLDFFCCSCGVMLLSLDNVIMYQTELPNKKHYLTKSKDTKQFYLNEQHWILWHHILAWLYNTFCIRWLWRIYWEHNLVSLVVHCQVIWSVEEFSVPLLCLHIVVLVILEKDAVQWRFSLTTIPRRTFRLAARSTADTTPRPRHQQGRGQAEHDLWVGTAGGASSVCPFQDSG